MNWIGNILIILFLSVGALAAATAYHVPVDLPAEAYVHSGTEDGKKHLTIKSPTGVVVFTKEDEFQAALAKVRTSDKQKLTDPALVALSRVKAKDLEKVVRNEENGLVLVNGAAIPLAGKNDPLTPDLLKVLNEQAQSDDDRIRQSYVIVQEFSFSRWPGKWVFLIAVVGLLGGVMLVRTSAKRELAEAKDTQAGEGPKAAIEGMKADLQTLLKDLDKEASELPPGQKDFRLLLILERLSEIQRTHLSAFVEARTPLIARFGLGGFAQIMDRFAACERQINRAWSAAADGIFAESLECLHTAEELTDEVLQRMA